MKRKLYPSDAFDRFSFWIAILLIVSGIFILITLGTHWKVNIVGVSEDGLGFIIWGIIQFASSYFFPSSPIERVNEYDGIISDMDIVARKIKKLGIFLENQRRSVEEAEGTLSQLRAEKNSLEPAIAMERETIEAIIKLYGKRTSREVWKERTVAFILGITASLIATVIYRLLSTGANPPH